MSYEPPRTLVGLKPKLDYTPMKVGQQFVILQGISYSLEDLVRHISKLLPSRSSQNGQTWRHLLEDLDRCIYLLTQISSPKRDNELTWAEFSTWAEPKLNCQKDLQTALDQLRVYLELLPYYNHILKGSRYPDDAIVAAFGLMPPNLNCLRQEVWNSMRSSIQSAESFLRNFLESKNENIRKADHQRLQAEVKNTGFDTVLHHSNVHL